MGPRRIITDRALGPPRRTVVLILKRKWGEKIERNNSVIWQTVSV